MREESELEAVKAAVAAFLPTPSEAMGRDIAKEMEQNIRNLMLLRSPFPRGKATRAAWTLKSVCCNNIITNEIHRVVSE